MSWLKLSLVLSTGVLLVGLCATAALSDDAPPSRDRGDNWDSGPVLGALAQSGPAEVRRSQPPPGKDDGPPGPPNARGNADRERPQPPGDSDLRRQPGPRGEDRDRRSPPDVRGGRDQNGPPPPSGREGDRLQPPGRPAGYPAREDSESLRTTDPELYKAIQEDRDLERQTRDQAEQYRRAGKAEQSKIKEKLVEIVNKHFGVRQQLRNLEVKRLEQQLKQLRDKIDLREKNRQEIVEKRIIELTGDDEENHF